MNLKMDLDANKVELLMRSALLEDATTVNERLGAIIADITVLDDDEVCISLDEDLWPDAEKATKVEALAEMLWIEVIWEGTSGAFPFAWPGLGEHTNSTPDYFKMVLDAYGSQKPKG
ncbi:hypothetical protein [Ruegeria atlantica]|uniref:hypothetical protein n=1 Tax=Ruegeria atlantica TaxID=81569 RepID=UPI0014818FFC|nr:hypothetical protein [Ruegeria atlantica]